MEKILSMDESNMVFNKLEYDDVMFEKLIDNLDNVNYNKRGKTREDLVMYHVNFIEKFGVHSWAIAYSNKSYERITALYLIGRVLEKMKKHITSKWIDEMNQRLRDSGYTDAYELISFQ